ncbi:MAG: LacI family DNA-binding transcriptional regulator, partial [Fervidobacterium sp.]
LSEYGIPFDRNLVYEIEEGYDSAYKKVKEIIDKGVDFDGIFCFNDVFAIGTIAALKDANIRVPEDVAVIGYDDIYFSRFISPPLSTVRIDKITEGKLAFEMLYQILKKRSGKNIKKVLDVNLVVRASTKRF